jgi:hypothetical protein
MHLRDLEQIDKSPSKCSQTRDPNTRDQIPKRVLIVFFTAGYRASRALPHPGHVLVAISNQQVAGVLELELELELAELVLGVLVRAEGAPDEQAIGFV